MVTIEDVFLEKMFKHYRLNGKAFACIKNVGKGIVSGGKFLERKVSGFIGSDESENDESENDESENDGESENDSANDDDSNSDCDSD